MATKKSQPPPVEPKSKVAAPPTTATAEPDFDLGKSRPVSEYPDLEDVLPALAARSVELAAKVKAMESERKELSAQIGLLLKAAGAESIRGDSWVTFIASKAGSRSIKAELLLTAGVDMDVIEACTVVGKPSSYVTVKALTAKGGE